MSYHPLRIFSGSAHKELALEIADTLGVELGQATTRRLPDSEIHVMIDEVVRDQDIFLVQSCCGPVNDHVMELMLYLDAFRRASAHSVSVVVPYFPYARQERMAHGRESVSARVIANMLEMMGADRVIFVDIHARANPGLFQYPCGSAFCPADSGGLFSAARVGKCGCCEPGCRPGQFGGSLCAAAESAACGDAQEAHECQRYRNDARCR